MQMEEYQSNSDTIFRQLQGNIMSVTANLLVAPPNAATQKHLHPHRWHIGYTIRGKGTVVVRNKRYKLRPGDIIVIYPNEPHIYAADHTNPYTIYHIHIECSGNVPHVFPRYFKASMLSKSGMAIFRKLNYLSHRSSSPSRGPRIMALLWLLLAELYDMGYQSKGTASTPLCDKNYTAFSAVTDKLQHEPFRFPGVDALAAQMHICRRVFTRFFRDNTGMSPREYYLTYLMTRAKQLLALKRHSLKEISGMCGYSNAQNFLRAYKRYLAEGRW